jgi:hypothetical protein
MMHFHDDAADQNEKYRRRRNIETSIFLASIDTFLQNPGIDIGPSLLCDVLIAVVHT